MNLLIFAIIVLIVLALLIWAVDMIPMDNRLSLAVKVLLVLVAVLVIVNRAGLA